MENVTRTCTNDHRVHAYDEDAQLTNAPSSDSRDRDARNSREGDSDGTMTGVRVLQCLLVARRSGYDSRSNDNEEALT